MSPQTITFATRRSALALAQSRAFIRDLIAANPGLVVEELQIVTTGDRVQDRPLSEIGGKGLFVKEIEEALLDRRADLAVHSMKDLPAELPEGLVIACTPMRADPRDVLLVRAGVPSLQGLPQGARVGSSSLRRKLSLLAVRPDLDVTPLRGNVDTRLRKVEQGEADAIVLARAGLVRLGLADRATEILEPETTLPALGQGALGIEARENDVDLARVLATLHDVETAVCVSAERGVLGALGGDCKTSIAAFAKRDGTALFIRAFIAEPDGSRPRRHEERIAWPSEAEARLAGEAVGEKLRG
ncbi:MAG: hydroxymethylbilane synthase [Polyangiales bacterium]